MIKILYTDMLYVIIIPNTAVFGPTNFIGTTIASTITSTTARMKKEVLRWPDGAIRKILLINLFFVNLIYIIFN